MNRAPGEDFDIFDVEQRSSGQVQSLSSMIMEAPGASSTAGGQRPQVAGDIMPGAFMCDDDCFDLFIDFIESDEWLLPIESFIDYFCVLFPTQDYNQNRPEKTKIFQEYSAIVKTNLNGFLTEILNYNND